MSRTRPLKNCVIPANVEIQFFLNIAQKLGSSFRWNDGATGHWRPLKTFALIALTAFATTALAQSSGGDYRLVRHVTAAGGGQSSGGGYTLRATLGQAEAAAQPMQGGGFTLRSGYWTAATRDDPDTPGGDPIFSDGFENTGGTP